MLLAIILLFAKAGGYLSTRLGQPSVLGELIVGLVLGPSLLNITHLSWISDAHVEESIFHLGELGVLMLMFLAGLELHLSDLARNTRVSAFAGILGVVVPVALGGLAGELFGMDFNHAAFLGLTLGATSVSISAQTLIELKVIRSRVGLGLLGAAVFDDVLVILLLSTFLALVSGTGGVIQILLVFLRMLAYLAVSTAFGLWLLPAITRRVARLPISFGVVTLALVVMFAYGLAAEVVGEMAAITGTFLAGLMFARTPEKSDIEDGFRALAYSFFVPIFFVNIGLSVNIQTLELDTLWFLLIISVIAVLGKIVGAGGGARLGKMSWRESLQLGIGMVSRGEVGLIVAQVGMNQGYLSSDIFSTIVGMVLLTTLVTPPMLRASFAQPKPQAELDDLQTKDKPEPKVDQEAQ
ncbi:MAG: cation:proton antiporter [Anaerolineaceae bacterium]|nr:cation:proton antiporter [Anaerolineaceae bacterium]